ncbi:MAG: serine protease, partial [Pseudomonadota bacterium]
MERFTQRQFEQIAEASNQLFQLHPELDPSNEKAIARSQNEHRAEKESNFRELVTESLPDSSETEIRRHVVELVALSEGRPAILIKDDNFDLTDHETLPDVITEILTTNRQAMRQAIRGVGRIEVSNHPQRSWIGTGFVVAGRFGEHIVITNRHVAIEMAFRNQDGSYRFVDGLLGNQPINASLDLKEEVISTTSDRSMSIPIVEVLHIEEPSGPDLAFLRLGEARNSPNVSPLRFSAEIELNIPVAAIGYPAKDTRETDIEVVIELLGDVFNKKRLAPGVLKSIDNNVISHDCSTLGGNSGSPIIDMRSGTVAGVHYWGTFPNPINHAVSATRVAEILDHSLQPNSRLRRNESANTNRTIGSELMPTYSFSDNNKITIDIPLRITVELGQLSETQQVHRRVPASISVAEAVSIAQENYGSLAGVVDIRSGLHLLNGNYSNDPAVVISIDHNMSGSGDTVAVFPAHIE